MICTARFSNNSPQVAVKTVSDVINELSRLPGDLPVKHGSSEFVDLVIFNRNHNDTYLGFEDGGDWTGEADDD